MAVVVQEIVAGTAPVSPSTVSPDDPSRSVHRGRHGLNQGLVDGTVEPDRWTWTEKPGGSSPTGPAERERPCMPPSREWRFALSPPAWRRRRR
jgi:pyruvate,water dikinase